MPRAIPPLREGSCATAFETNIKDASLYPLLEARRAGTVPRPLGGPLADCKSTCSCLDEYGVVEGLPRRTALPVRLLEVL